MKSKDVLRILGISRVTLWSYVKFGKIKVTKLSNGFYDYDDKSVYDCAGKKNKVNVIYARVSTYKQKDDLKRQVQLLNKYCLANKIVVDKTYSEISSGIDLDRKEFNSMLNDIFQYKVDKVIISNKDRLTRLSFVTLQKIFQQFGTTIVVVNQTKKSLSDVDDIFEELISMMHYFSTKKYSQRKNSLNKNE